MRRLQPVVGIGMLVRLVGLGVWVASNIPRHLVTNR
jgi:hypothetical protein